MIISYLKYRRKAQGKYHLHSPLVFELYEKVLEPSSSFRAKRFFSPSFRPKRSEVETRAKREHSPQVNKSPKELFYDVLDKRLKSFINANPLIFKSDDVVMIVKDIHRNKQNEADWERLKNDEKVRLSIDCWHFGMIFVMDRIKKEHYILKV